MTRVEIVTTGNEVLEGKVLNTNASFLAREMADLGYPPKHMNVVGDTISEIAGALEEAWHRAQIVLVSGGLGPTHDDVTREAILKFFKVSPVLHPQSLENIRNRLVVQGKPWTPGSEKQAWIPENSTALFNAEGTAPGFYIEKEGKVLAALPGVPHECERMFREELLPVVRAHYPSSSRARKRIRTTGIGETQIFQTLDYMKWLSETVQVSFLPTLDGVDIDVAGVGEVFRDTARRIRSAVAQFIYSESPDLPVDVPADTPLGAKSLVEAIAQILIRRQKKLAVAESCSGGLLSDILTNVPGSSEYFRAGIVAYSNEAKIHFLGVAGETIERFGAVSAFCAGEMAAGVRRATGSDIGMATTGIAGPAGGTPLKPTGIVYIAYADGQKCLAQKLVFPNGRRIHKERTARSALTMLWQQVRS